MADVSVRPARLADATAMAEVQRRVWCSIQALPDAAPIPELAAFVRGWERAVMVPPTEHHTAWVATADQAVVGLATLAPATDPDLVSARTAELVLLAVDPSHRNLGHGSRLLTATMQSAVDGGCSTAVAWVIGGDDRTRAFLEGAGWVPDGAHRTLAQSEDDPPASRLGLIRLATDLTAPEAALSAETIER